MKELIINKIIELNKKYYNTYLADLIITGFEDIQRYILKQTDDKMLLETFELLIRYEEKMKFLQKSTPIKLS